MVVAHRSKRAVAHRVLEISRLLKACNDAGEIPPDGEVAGAPGYARAEAEEPGGNAVHGQRGFAPMDIAGEVHLDAAGQIKAALSGCMDHGNLIEFDHEFDWAG